MNRQAFAWGRRAAADPAEIFMIAAAAKPGARRNTPAKSFDEIVARRETFLTAYQNAAYAARYRALVDRAALAEAALTPGASGFAEAVAKGYFKLLAIKDEYEIARLYSDGSFARQMAETFEGDLKITYHLSPPIAPRRNKKGEPVKTAFGPWLRKLFPALAAAKRLRGTPFDLFGYTQERKQERQSIADYEKMVAGLINGLGRENHPLAAALAALPGEIKGFGHVKERNRLAAKAKEEALLAQWNEAMNGLRWAAE
jgi:indolepyruvate ferredoxin oxidoreductase